MGLRQPRPPKATEPQRQQIEQLSGTYPKHIPHFTKEKAEDFIARLQAGESFEVKLANGQTLTLSPHRLSES